MAVGARRSRQNGLDWRERDLALLEKQGAALIERDPEIVAETVHRCVRTKGNIVAQDPFEHGPRRVLNFGHTFAHAIELCAGFSRVPHGEAVACGIILALRAADEIGMLEDPDLCERVEELCRRFELPCSLESLRRDDRPLDLDGLLKAFAHDKKGSFGEPEFVLPRAVGDFDLSVRLDREFLERTLD